MPQFLAGKRIAVMEVPEEIAIAGDAAHIIHEAQAVSLDADGLFLLVYLGGSWARGLFFTYVMQTFQS